MIETALTSAWLWRKQNSLIEKSEALRIFYGPGETNDAELKDIAVDRFGDHLWITLWSQVREPTLVKVARFYESLFRKERLSLVSVVVMDRSEVNPSGEVRTLTGTARMERYTVKEKGIPYRVQMANAKHPGLFLDHAPLRQWLSETQKDKSVLNLFAYTGSLSVAAATGGATRVTTLDLSKATIEWAEENWKHAGFALENGNFIYGDVFEWLPRLRKKAERFDTILCDPPSFSRSKSGTFSTQKDSARLHEEIFPLLKPGGVLVTSINSENYPERNFLKDIETAASNCKTNIRILRRVDLPESFPTGMDLKERYLKGFYLLNSN